MQSAVKNCMIASRRRFAIRSRSSDRRVQVSVCYRPVEIYFPGLSIAPQSPLATALALISIYRCDRWTYQKVPVFITRRKRRLSPKADPVPVYGIAYHPGFLLELPYPVVGESRLLDIRNRDRDGQCERATIATIPFCGYSISNWAV
jgi:hypothetical protein